jgi:hypothetical protein
MEFTLIMVSDYVILNGQVSVFYSVIKTREVAANEGLAIGTPDGFRPDKILVERTGR